MRKIYIYENNEVLNLEPIVLTRPAFDLRCGAFTFLERIQNAFPDAEIELIVRNEIQPITEELHPDLTVNPSKVDEGLWILGNVLWQKEDLEAEFIIFTNVDGAKLNFGEPNQKDLRLLTAAEAQQLCDDGNFPAGSMGPKIQAAINFVRGGGKKACITAVASFRETLAGNAGTTIVP